MIDNERSAASLIETAPEGVTTSVTDRRVALGEVASLYATYAKAEGGVRALKSSHRSAVERRIQNASHVMERAKRKATYSQEQEDDAIEPLMASQSLIEAGFDAKDVETMRLIMKIQLRQAVGISVGHKKRGDAVGRLYSEV
jgi:hypothetical protein